MPARKQYQQFGTRADCDRRTLLAVRSYAEVARILGVSASCVQQYEASALRKLSKRAAMQELGRELFGDSALSVPE